MERFANQPLGPAPHLAVLSSSKVGNFVVTTPLLRGLKEKYPDATLDFFGSTTTADFESDSPWIDFRYPLHGRGTADPDRELRRAVRQRIQSAGPYALAINCDEFAELNLETVDALAPRYVVGGVSGGALRDRLPPPTLPEQRLLADDDWTDPAFLQRYAEVLDSNYIGEIFCRMAWVDTDFFALELPQSPPAFEVPDVLIHATTTRAAKMWPARSWQAVLDWCAHRGLSTGLIGSAPREQEARYNAGSLEQRLLEQTDLSDLRGRTPLLELAGALARARALVTVDAGPLHVAAAVGCPTVAIFGTDEGGTGASPRDLWAPRRPFVRVTRSEHHCRICRAERYRNTDCLVEGHPCMAGVPAEQVTGLLAELLAEVGY